VVLDRQSDGGVRVPYALLEVEAFTAFDLEDWPMRAAPQPVRRTQNRGGGDRAAHDDPKLFPAAQATFIL
jgi:hypothetical protein